MRGIGKFGVNRKVIVRNSWKLCKHVHSFPGNGRKWINGFAGYVLGLLKRELKRRERR